MAIATHFFYLTAFILGIFYSISAKSNEAEFATKHIASNVILITYQDAKNDTPYQAKDESSSIHYFHSASAPPPPPKEDFIPPKEKDRCEKIILWYYHAADQGNVRAQVMLGFSYLDGRGVPQSKTIAKTWFKKACEQGYKKSCDFYQHVVDGVW